MLQCTCMKCSHQWAEYLGVTTTIGGVVQPINPVCPACEAGGVEEMDAEDRRRLNAMRLEDLQMDRYYSNKYGA